MTWLKTRYSIFYIIYFLVRLSTESFNISHLNLLSVWVSLNISLSLSNFFLYPELFLLFIQPSICIFLGFSLFLSSLISFRCYFMSSLIFFNSSNMFITVFFLNQCLSKLIQLGTITTWFVVFSSYILSFIQVSRIGLLVMSFDMIF